MVIGKFKYLIGPASGTRRHPLGRSRFFLFGRTGAEWSDSVVGGVFRIHMLERKGKSSVGGSEVDPHACGLGSHGRLKFDSESSASHGMRLLTDFGHTE